MFTVIARDDYDNLRTDWKDTMVSYALNMEPTLLRTHGASAYGARGGRVWRCREQQRQWHTKAKLEVRSFLEGSSLKGCSYR